MGKQAFLFDMDGTLIDSMDYWNNLKHRVCDLYFKRTGVKIVLSESEQQKIEMLSTKRAIRYINENHSSSVDFDLDCAVDIARFYETECKLKPNVLDTLELLKSMGVKMAVCTATPKALAEKALRAMGVRDYFKFVITPEQVKGGKFHKPIFYVSAFLLRCRIKNLVLIDDAPYALSTAERTGCKTVAMHDEYRKEKITDEGTLQCENFAELYEYIKENGGI